MTQEFIAPEQSARNGAERPWERLPSEAYTALTPHLPALADEMIATIQSEVAEYDRPLEGDFGAALREAVDGALGGFVAMAQSPGLGRAGSRELYVRLGRLEAREGRPLEALLAAYRVGARVAWRTLARLGLERGLTTETLIMLAESIFAYIDELSAESAEGYAREQAERAGEIERRRAHLIALLVQAPAADPAALAEAS